jgi:hypothetical protein
MTEDAAAFVPRAVVHFMITHLHAHHSPVAPRGINMYEEMEDILENRRCALLVTWAGRRGTRRGLDGSRVNEGGSGSALLRAERALAQLTKLESLDYPRLPTARCFLAGKHTRHRSLCVTRVADASAPLSRLLAACPRLARVEQPGRVLCSTLAVPPGWRTTDGAWGGTLPGRT